MKCQNIILTRVKTTIFPLVREGWFFLRSFLIRFCLLPQCSSIKQVIGLLRIFPFGKRFFLLCPPITLVGTLLFLTLLLLASKICTRGVKLPRWLESSARERQGALKLCLLRTGWKALDGTLPTQNCQNTKKIRL